MYKDLRIDIPTLFFSDFYKVMCDDCTSLFSIPTSQINASIVHKKVLDADKFRCGRSVEHVLKCDRARSESVILQLFFLPAQLMRFFSNQRLRMLEYFLTRTTYRFETDGSLAKRFILFIAEN